MGANKFYLFCFLTLLNVFGKNLEIFTLGGGGGVRVPIERVPVAQVGVRGSIFWHDFVWHGVQVFSDENLAPSTPTSSSSS